MPFYEYECTSCKFYTEVLQKITDAPLRKCPSCGRNTLKKLVSAPVFRLKGSGWYETDFKSDREEKRNLATSDHEESKADSKSESSSEKSSSESSESRSTRRAARKSSSTSSRPSTAKSAPARAKAKPARRPAAKLPARRSRAGKARAAR